MAMAGTPSRALGRAVAELWPDDRHRRQRWPRARSRSMARFGDHPGRLKAGRDRSEHVRHRAQLASLIVDLYGLTEREREVTELLVRGLAIKEIATTLSMSLHTTRDHIKAVFAKFRVSSRPELTAKLFHDHYARGPASVTQ